jgi:hypothetical protein
MSHTLYTIHRRINRPLEFRGLQAQYVWWLGGGVITLLLLFALLHIAGIPPLACLTLIAILSTAFIRTLYWLSRKYGQHGLMKRRAARKLPAAIRCNSRNAFFTGQ